MPTRHFNLSNLLGLLRPFLVASGLIAHVSVAGAEVAPKSTALDEIVVAERDLSTPTRQSNESVYTGTEVTRKGLEAQGTNATTSVYHAVGALPGVTVESADSHGLDAEQKNLRIRGVRAYSAAMTVEGVPNWGGNPMGPRDYIYDTENLQSIAVYKGAVPADLGTGVGARGGAVELRLRWPKPGRGFELNQSVGFNKYIRTFVRIDSGALPLTGSTLALSYSYTAAEKWKGPGDLGGRHNVGLMLTQRLWATDEIKLWFNYNHQNQDLYRPLSHFEVTDLEANHRKDFASSLRGVPSEDINYFGYNRGEYRNRDVLAIFPVTVHDAVRIEFKPYASWEDSQILGGATSQGGSVQKRIRDIARHGVVSSMHVRTSVATATAGYWFESNDMVVRTENYNPVGFAFSGHGMQTKNDGNGIVHSPFMKLAGRVASLDWQVGLKYFYYRDPASQGYTSAAPEYALVPAGDLHRERKVYDALLPTIGVGYHASEAVELYAAYGRNQIRPYSYMPLVTLYNQNRATFQGAGVALNDLFKGYDMEISDNFEFGSRSRSDWLEVMPAVFLSKHRNLLTTVYDPRVGLEYSQNVGKATGYGVELETNLFLQDTLQVFVNPTYTILRYDKNLTYQGEVLETKGKQVVDAPVLSLKTGVLFAYRGFRVTPMARYLSARYGDAQHEERVDGYFVADLRIGYHTETVPCTRALRGELEFRNLFASKYISLIQAADDNRAGNRSYYVGAPFNATLTLSAEL